MLGSIGKKKKSIQKDILIFISGSIVIIVCIIIAVNRTVLSSRLRDIRHNEIVNLFNYHLLKINDLTGRMEMNVLSLAHTGELLYDQSRESRLVGIRAVMDRYLAAQIRDMPIILGGGIWFEPDTIVRSVRYVGPYAYWSGESVKTTWEYSNGKYDYFNHMWYRIAVPDDWDLGKKRDRMVYVTPPYYDLLNKQNVVFITMSAPLYAASGKIIGVATTDWSPEVIEKNLRKLFITPSSFVFLADQTTRAFLYHPDAKLVMKKMDLVEWGPIVGPPPARSEYPEEKSVTVGGKPYILMYTVSSAGFIFGAMISREEMYAPIERIIIINIIIAASFIFLLGAWLYFFIARAVIRPITLLNLFGNEVAAGNLEKRLVHERNDEFGELAGDLNRMAARLDESIASTRSIIEFMPSMLIQVSEDGRIVRWNELANRLFEGCPGSPAGKRIAETETALAKFQEAAEKVCVSGNAEFLHREKLAGFEDMVFNVHIFPLRLKHERYAVVRIDDITDLEKKNEQIRRAQKLESIGLLAGGIAHDFNNILSGIMGTVSLLRYRMKKRGMPSPEDLDRDMGIIETSSESGASIVSQLLDMAKQGKEADFSPINLVVIVNQIVKISSKSIDKSIEFNVSLPGDNCYVMGNGSQLQQCLLNLCINGAQSMTTMRESGERRGGVLFIEIEKVDADRYFLDAHPGARMSGYWRLAVRDTGVGINKKLLPKIFDPFFSTKDKGMGRGTGLGLSVVYSIVNNHEGYIDVYSEPGLGSSFNLYFPVYDAGPDETVREAEHDICRGSGTVLVIDDDEAVRNSVRSMLEECGFTVIAARGGDEGITEVRERPGGIDLVFLDLVMPGKSGGEVLREIVAVQNGIRVIITSGLYSKELVDELLSAGAMDFIQKPFTIYTLSRKVWDALDTRRE